MALNSEIRDTDSRRPLSRKIDSVAGERVSDGASERKTVKHGGGDGMERLYCRERWWCGGGLKIASQVGDWGPCMSVVVVSSGGECRRLAYLYEPKVEVDAVCLCGGSTVGTIGALWCKSIYPLYGRRW